jgi:hypothetical protein
VLDAIASVDWFSIGVNVSTLLMLEIEMPCPLLCFFKSGIGAGVFV